jgi:non-specific serine/threonine protein kinase
VPIQKIVSEVVCTPRDPATASRREGPLTARETEVAALVVDGRSNREIAALLIISERTVENHVSHILNKLEVDSRGQLARRTQTSR